jgi:hypothetical protein
MPNYVITYDITDSYVTPPIQAESPDEALAIFHSGEYDSSSDKCFYSELLDTVEVEEES